MLLKEPDDCWSRGEDLAGSSAFFFIPPPAGFLAALMKGGVGKNAGYLNSIWEYSNPASGWM